MLGFHRVIYLSLVTVKSLDSTEWQKHHHLLCVLLSLHRERKREKEKERMALIMDRDMD